MSYVVLARRFRPQTFDEVVGQEHVASTLRNAIKAGRLAHAYLFSGPRGVGKTSMARIMAKALNCRAAEGPTADPCGKCDSCREIPDGRSLDVIEMDAASHTGVDDVRLLREGAMYSAARDRFKVYIVDEAHMMSRSAFNALLKMLEEPPAHVKFVFATTEPERLPDTIVSRCQRFDFRRIGPADCLKRLEQIAAAERIEVGPGALALVARRSRGGLRDAEGLLDQLAALRAGGCIGVADVMDMVGAVPDETVGRLLDSLAAGRPAGALEAMAGCLEAGAEVEEIATALADRLRGALLVAVAGRDSLLISGEYAHLADQLASEAARTTPAGLLRMNSVLAEARRAMRGSPEPRLVLELALVRLAQLPDLVDLRELVERLDRPGTATAASPAAPGPRASPFAPAPPRGPAARATPARTEVSPFSDASLSAPPPRPPAPATPAVATSPAELPGRWTALRDALKAAAPAIDTLLDGFDPTGVEGDRLVLSPRGPALFQQEQLESPERMKALGAAAAAAFGRPLRIIFRRSAGGSPARPAAPAAPAAPTAKPAAQPAAAPEPAAAGDGKSDTGRAADQPAVRKLLAKFDGRVVKVGKKK